MCYIVADQVSLLRPHHGGIWSWIMITTRLLGCTIRLLTYTNIPGHTATTLQSIYLMDVVNIVILLICITGYNKGRANWLLAVASYLTGTHESWIDLLSSNSWPGAIPGFFFKWGGTGGGAPGKSENSFRNKYSVEKWLRKHWGDFHISCHLFRQV